jgi:hypothetical protein
MFGNVIYIFVAQCGSLSVLIFYDQEIADKHRRTEIVDGTDFRWLLEKTFVVADNVEDLFADFPFLNINHGTLQFTVVVRELIFNFNGLVGLVDNVD